MIAWFTRNSVAANLLMMGILIGGLMAMNSQLQIEVFPSGKARYISVAVALRSATPEDMELSVAIRIEEAIQDLEGIREIVSNSQEGATTVRIEVEQGYSARDILGDVKSRVDAINTFPSEAEKPVVSITQRNYPVISVTLSGDVSELELRALADAIRDDLLRQPNISQAELNFQRAFEIAVEVPQDRLRDTGLSLSAIALEIRNSSLDTSAGNIRAEGGDVLIRSRGQAYRKDEFERIVVKTNPDGSIVRLADVATVLDGFEEDGIKAEINGQRGLMINVSRAGTESALEIAASVKSYVEAKQKTLPENISLGYWDDDSQVLKSRLGTMLSNLLQGSILVIVLLTLFLRPAIAFWVFLGIPISFIGAFMILGQLGISINMMSLYGFILVIGLVVDDAIVTGESIYTSLSKGGDGTEAAIAGTHRVAIPVTFGVLTTVAAFIPMATMKGHFAELWGAVPIVIGSILLFSLIESKFVLPAHLKHINLTARKSSPLYRFEHWQQRFADRFEQGILRYYQPLLSSALHNRYSVVASFVGLFLLITALLTKGWIPFTFMPRINAETVTASLTMPVGTPEAVLQRHIETISNAANELREEYTDSEGRSGFATILSVAGSGGRRAAANQGRVAIETLPVEQRHIDIDSAELSRQWRERIGTIAGAESLTFRSELTRFGDPVNVQLSGQSLQTLELIAGKIKQRLATYPTVFEIADSLSDGKDELRVELTEQGHVLGLNRASILTQIGEAFRGFEAQRIQRGRDDIRVLVRLPRSERGSSDSLSELLIETPDGRKVPLSLVADIKPGTGPANIRRVDRFRVVNVTADFDKGNTNAVALTADLKAYIDDLLLAYPGIQYSLEGEAREQREATESLQWGAIALLFLIYALLALPLKSYTQPLIVMSIIPFGLIGAVLGHLITGYTMVIMSYLGLLALIGVVVNDSLVLVDFINQSTRKGLALKEAVVNAGTARFRAVMLTSLTTFFGLLPMMFASSTQSLFLVPMAISLGFGILFATAITLLLVPCNTLIADDIRQRFSRTPRSADNTVGTTP